MCLIAVSDNTELPKNTIIKEICSDGNKVRDFTSSVIIDKATDGHNAGVVSI